MSNEGRIFRAPQIQHLPGTVRGNSRTELALTTTDETVDNALPTENQKRMDEAKRILGQDFLGPAEVTKAFGIELSPDQIPPLDTTPDVLKWAKSQGLMLVLRIDNATGSPLTIERMERILQPEFSARNAGRVINRDSFYLDQHFFTEATSRAGWFFVSKDAVGGTDCGITYLDQSHKIGEFLIDNKKIIGNQIPLDAIRYLNLQNEELQTLVKNNPEQAVALLSYFSLNQAVRQTPVEAVYDLLLYFQNTGKRLLADKTTLVGGANIFTRSFNHFIKDNRFIGVGYFDRDGIRITRHNAGGADPRVGAIIAFPVPKPTSDQEQ